MASPRRVEPSSSAAQPLTPPAEPHTKQTAAIPTPQTAPPTSLADTGTGKRPRDARLIHMLLASMGVTAYQERVPIQLLDFAYRYTSGVLQDALHLQAEGYPETGNQTGGGGRGQHINNDFSSLNLQALRLSIQSRMHYQFQQGLPKEFLTTMAEERNRIALPRGTSGGDHSAGPTLGGMRLPHERYCLTGVGWGLKDEWDSAGEEEEEVEGAGQDHELGEEEEAEQAAENEMFEDAMDPDGGEVEDDDMPDA